MNIAQIIKFEGDNRTFIWKHPKEDFNMLTQLIVHESQEAIFFMNGQALDLFGPGRHTLESQNIPFVRSFFCLATDKQTPFHCEVYFINMAEQMLIKWGTDSKVQYIEPTYNFPLSIGASGEMSLKVENSRKLLLKLVGTESYLSQEKLTGFFRAFLMTKVKSHLAQTIREQKINIFEIDEHLHTLSEDLHRLLIPDFSDYGISLERFFVSTVVRPDGERQYEAFKDLYFRQYADVTEAKLRQQVEMIEQQTEAQKLIMESQAIAKKREQEGYTYQQERGFDVAETLVDNEGVGNFSTAGIGLGMMTGISEAVAAPMSEIFQQTTAPLGTGTLAEDVKKHFCDNCGTVIAADAAFCDECGTSVAQEPSCQACGFVFQRKGKFCPGCGAKRED